MSPRLSDVARWWRMECPPEALARAPLAPPAPDPRGRPLALTLLAALTLLYCGSSVRWALMDSIAPMWDQSRHAWDALRLADFLRSIPEDPVRLGDVLVWHDSQYAYIGYLPTALAHLVFGPSFRVAALVMALLWTPLLLLSMAWLGTLTTGSALGGVVAAAFIAASPMVIDLSKDYLLDLPMLSLTALSLALLVRSRMLLQRNASIGFGVAAGFLMLTKAVMPATFIIAPLGFAIWNAWRAGAVRVFARNAVVGAMAGGFVCLPYHLRNIDTLRRLFFEQGRNAAAEGDPTSYLESLGLYLFYLVDQQARGFLIIPVLLGIWAWWKRSRAWTVFTVGSFIICLLIWPLFPNKDARYTLSALSLLGVCAAGLIVAPSWEHLRKALAGGMVTLALFMVVVVQWGIGALPEVVRVGSVRVFAQDGYLRHQPDTREPSVEKMLKELQPTLERESLRHAWRRPLLHVTRTHDEPHHHSWNVEYYSWVLDRPVQHMGHEERLSAVEYWLHTDCGTERTPPPEGYSVVVTAKSPRDCDARLMVNQELLRRETQMRQTPRTSIRYRVGMMDQEVIHALVPAEASPGGTLKLGLVIHIHRNRRPQHLHRTIQVGPATVTWRAPDDAFAVDGAYVLPADLTLPSDMPAGEHEVTLRISDHHERAVPLTVDGTEQPQVSLGRVVIR